MKSKLTAALTVGSTQTCSKIQWYWSLLAPPSTLVVLGLILPIFPQAVPGAVYAPAQLILVVIMSLMLCLFFLFVHMYTHHAEFMDLKNENGHERAVSGPAWMPSSA